MITMATPTGASTPSSSLMRSIPARLPEEIQDSGIKTSKGDIELIKNASKVAEAHYRENYGKVEKK